MSCCFLPSVSLLNAGNPSLPNAEQHRFGTPEKRTNRFSALEAQPHATRCAETPARASLLSVGGIHASMRPPAHGPHALLAPLLDVRFRSGSMRPRTQAGLVRVCLAPPPPHTQAALKQFSGCAYHAPAPQDQMNLRFSPTAESFGVSAQISSGVVRGSPQVRLHEVSTRVPRGFARAAGWCEH